MNTNLAAIPSGPRFGNGYVTREVADVLQWRRDFFRLDGRWLMSRRYGRGPAEHERCCAVRENPKSSQPTRPELRPSRAAAAQFVERQLSELNVESSSHFSRSAWSPLLASAGACGS